MKINKSTIILIGKIVLLFFLAIYSVSMVSYFWETATEEVIWEGDHSRHINKCETYLREKEYGELWDYMQLYDLEGSRYNVYWEAVENRLTEIQNEQAQRAQESE